MNIKVYPREIADGIGDMVKSTASVAYCSEASVKKGELAVAKEVINNEEVLEKVLAENKDQIDLYYIESVLVSTGWNKNDDVFLSAATWDARNTPEDKQFNYMHDEDDIIGHITGSYVLTKDGKSLGDDEDIPRPEEFDIITQAVLYNSWTGEENRERMAKIIAEVEEGKWYVSMECLFAGFDYALIDENGNAKILARDEESAFLTKHLRAYGGSGKYEGYKVGRALSNISFSGIGLVSKPANPRSVILSSKSAAQIITDKFSIGDFDMSDVLTTQLAELKAELETAKAENEAIKAQIVEAKDKEFASQVAAFEAAAEESQATIDELSESIKSTQARVAELEDALNSSQTELAEAMKEMDKMKKKEAMMKRKASLVEAGFEEEDIEESLAAFESLNEEAFESVLAMYKKKAMKMKKKEDEAEAGMPPEVKEAIEKKKKEKEAKADEAEAEITPEAFEEVETSEASLVVAEEVEEVGKARAQVADWFAATLNQTK
jgi:hypothetical protein